MTIDAPAASASETMRSINESLRARGGKYGEYSCQAVSWDDVSRGTVGGGLSCWGANITDTYLKAKDGTPLYTVRSDNWNEKLGKVSSSEVALVGGNHVAGGAPLAPVTLRTFLKNIGAHGAYAGLDVADLSDDAVSIRFQTTFLPVAGARGTLEFATEAYNYNTMSDGDPRNLVLLCTTQGVAVQQDGAGAKRLFHHAVGDGERDRHRGDGHALQRAHDDPGAAPAEGEAEAGGIWRHRLRRGGWGSHAHGLRFDGLHRRCLRCDGQVRGRELPGSRHGFVLRCQEGRDVALAPARRDRSQAEARRRERGARVARERVRRVARAHGVRAHAPPLRARDDHGRAVQHRRGRRADRGRRAGS